MERDNYKEGEHQLSCFIVFSSREKHIPAMLERLVDLLENDLKVQPIRLDEARVPGRPIYSELIRLIEDCQFGVVFLDGFRPNILFELGIILAKGIPVAIFLEKGATINLESLFFDIHKKMTKQSLPIDVAKHVSDISNVGYETYDKDNDISFRKIARQALEKLHATIQKKKRVGKGAVRALIAKIDRAIGKGNLEYDRVIRQTFKSLNSLSPEDRAHIISHVVNSLVFRGKNSEALEMVSKALEFYDDAILRAQRSELLQQFGQADEAMKTALEGIKKYPNHPATLRALSIVAIEQGKPQIALNALKKLSFDEILSKNLLRILAKAQFSSGNMRGAIELLATNYRQNKSDSSLQLLTNLLTSPAAQRLDTQTATLVRKLLEEGERKGVLTCTGCLLRASANLKISHLIGKIAPKIKISGDVVEANSQAFLLISHGEFKDAKRILVKSIATHPDDSYLNATMGLYFLTAEKKESLGRKHYERAIWLAPNDLPLRRMYHYQMARFLLARKKYGLMKKELGLARKVKTKFLKQEIAEMG